MVRSDNVILHTLAGCSRDSVVALLDKYSPTDSHCEPSMLSSCVVKLGSGCTLVTCVRLYDLPSGHFIHSLYVLFCTAFITVFILFLFSFVYFSVNCTLCIFVFYNHCCPVRINKWMDGWITTKLSITLAAEVSM